MFPNLFLIFSLHIHNCTLHIYIVVYICCWDWKFKVDETFFFIKSGIVFFYSLFSYKESELENILYFLPISGYDPLSVLLEFQYSECMIRLRWLLNNDQKKYFHFWNLYINWLNVAWRCMSQKFWVRVALWCCERSEQSCERSEQALCRS